jgi:possible chaperone dnaJ
LEQNYYDILEVNKNASPEIIEKAYKTLVKKYHPDLQENDLKIKYEEKIKKINEAYSILSDSEKRKNYDLFLKNNEVSIDDYNKLYQENIILKKEINYLKNNYKQNNINNNLNNINYYIENIRKNNYEKYNTEKNKENNSKIENEIYEINYKRILKNILALIITIFIIFIISSILWHIPFTKNYLINLYEKNTILKSFISIFNK